MRKPIQVVTDSFPAEPALETAVSHALLLRVAGGELPDTLRLSRPGPMVSFGKRDALAAGYPKAVAAARRHGYEAVEGLAGGRAAAFHEGTLAFALTVADPAARSGIQARFDEAAGLIAGALRSLGVDARVGEVPGEYCRGAHSVNARGRAKLMGVGQRVIGGGAHVGGLIVVSGAERARDVLVPVYRALRFEWDPGTVGAVSEEVAGVGLDEVEAALIEAFAGRPALEEEGAVDEETLLLARRLAPEHLSP